MSSTPPVILPIPESVLRDSIISIGVSIGRGILQKYFPPTVFQKFDRDYKITELIIELFRDQPEAIQLLEQKGPEIEKKLHRRNVLQVLQGNPRVDFIGFIGEELGGETNPAFQVFQAFLQRIEAYENQEKERVFRLIDAETELSEEDYIFVLELFQYERCNLGEFQKLFKFIRNKQYIGPLIIASLRSMKNEYYKNGLIQLVEKKGTSQEKGILTEFK